MVVVADASVAIRGDMSGFHSDLRGAEAATGGLGARLKNVLSPKNIMLGAGVLGIGAGIRSLVDYAGEAADAFAELEQTQRTVKSVFGESAVVIEDFAKRAADAAGMSEQAVFKGAAVMGQTLKNMGFEARDAAEWVVKLQQRGAELAIAFGKTPERATLAILAAMRGERDTIEQFGVSIKQVDINARTAAMGLDTSTASAKKYADAMAILDIVMEQSNDTAFRFIEAEDSRAVKQAKFQANAANFQLWFGEQIAQFQSELYGLGTEVVGYADTVGGFFEDLYSPDKEVKLKRMADNLGITLGEAWRMVAESAEITGQSYDSTIDDMLVSSDELMAGAFNTYAAISTAAVEGMASAVAATEEGAQGIADAIPLAVLDNWENIRQAGVDTMMAYNAGIFDSQQSFIAEIDALLKALDENLAPGEEISLLRGRKMALMTARGIEEGKDMPDIGAIARIDQMIGDINSRLATLNGYSYGRNLVVTLANGISQNLGTASAASYALATKLRTPVRIESEPEEGPLRGITKWGGNIVKTIADGIYGELGTGSGAAYALAGALVPSLGGSGVMAAGGAGTGQTINYNLTVNGIPYQVQSPDEMLEALMNLGALHGDGRLG